MRSGSSTPGTPSTRPDQSTSHDNPRWRGLQIIDTRDGGVGDDTGVVEFRATYLDGDGNLGVLHERSPLRPRGRPVVLRRRGHL